MPKHSQDARRDPREGFPIGCLCWQLSHEELEDGHVCDECAAYDEQMMAEGNTKLLEASWFEYV